MNRFVTAAVMPRWDVYTAQANFQMLKVIKELRVLPRMYVYFIYDTRDTISYDTSISYQNTIAISIGSSIGSIAP